MESSSCCSRYLEIWFSCQVLAFFHLLIFSCFHIQGPLHLFVKFFKYLKAACFPLRIPWNLYHGTFCKMCGNKWFSDHLSCKYVLSWKVSFEALRSKENCFLEFSKGNLFIKKFYSCNNNEWNIFKIHRIYFGKYSSGLEFL